jgi:hypothetical protein
MKHCRIKQGIACIGFFICSVYSQNISTEFLSNRYLNVSYDHGISWEINSSFKPYQLENISELITVDSNNFSIDWITHDIKSLNFYTIINPRYIENKLQCNTRLGTLSQYA